MKKFLILSIFVFTASLAVVAQPRPAERANDAANAPVSYTAKYEGGIYGSTGREKGTLKLDDANSRVAFYRKDGKEMFSIPYDSIVVIYPDSKVSVSQTGNVVSRLPLPGAGLAGLMSDRAQYLILTFDDPDIDVKGNANFKFQDKKSLLMFIDALGTKARMNQRGNAYYRPKDRSL